MSTPRDLVREWTQQELKDYLLANGYTEKDFVEGEIIPQGVKFISFSPVTEKDKQWARRVIDQHPEWQRRMA